MNEVNTVLREAEMLVDGPRKARYGHPSKSFKQIAVLWSEVLGIQVTADQVVMCLIMMKMSREINVKKRDNIVDIAGYARVYEMLNEEYD